MSYAVDDDQYPASAVVYIESTWGTKTYTGSGFLAGRNDVITAAHVIYNWTLGGLADKITIYPSYNPKSWDNQGYGASWVEYYPDFDPDGDGKLVTGDFYRATYAGSEKDIALLSLPDPLGDAYGWFGIDWGFSGGNVGVIGHPGKYNTVMTYDGGTLTRSYVDAVYYIGADLEVNPGNSGGPIYYDHGSGPYAVGIVSTGIAATSLGGHQFWLQDAMIENDKFLSSPDTPSDIGTQDVYRFYNSANGTHFYTRSAAERDSIIANLKTYHYEGNSFDVPASGSSGLIDVYRFYNTANGSHFYTASAVERDNVIYTLPHYIYEGLAYHAYAHDDGSQMPLYRFFNTATGAHFFTPSTAERDSVIANLKQFVYEGIAFYVLPADGTQMTMAQMSEAMATASGGGRMAINRTSAALATAKDAPPDMTDAALPGATDPGLASLVGIGAADTAPALPWI